MTERFGWQGRYYLDIVWSVALIALAWRFIRPGPSALHFSEINWLSYVALSAGLVALILFMKREIRMRAYRPAS
jgi:hypothetical protein